MLPSDGRFCLCSDNSTGSALYSGYCLCGGKVFTLSIKTIKRKWMCFFVYLKYTIKLAIQLEGTLLA